VKSYLLKTLLTFNFALLTLFNIPITSTRAAHPPMIRTTHVVLSSR